MNRDLSDLLDEWPFEPGKINVRLIQGQDGDPIIQVRLDLGILQMRADGRPDGEHPNGYESLLEYHETRLDEHTSADPDPGPTPDDPQPPDAPAAQPGFRLTGDECRQLREEASQYSHRYIALLVLEDFEGVVRDTTRNLRMLDLLAAHGATQGDRQSIEPQRAYLTMMRARAMASQAVKDGEPKAAVLALDEGLAALKSVFDAQGRPEMFETCKEAEALRGMREALVPKLPVSQKAELRARLDEAILNENYELAAILRDELRMLPD